MMYCRKSDDGYATPAEGVRLKTLVHGEKTHMCEFRLGEGSMLPRHSHPHEQTGFLVSGRVDLYVEGDKLEARPGDSWCIPGDAEHWAESLADSVVVEVFSPVRDDYLS
jgi:quercetin dioxygenase-like cupin family protein